MEGAVRMFFEKVPSHARTRAPAWGKRLGNI
jgi:hypothetical protein